MEPCPYFLLIDRQDSPQPHEGTHDFDVDFDGPAAPKHAGEHGHALLRECKWRKTRIAMLLGTDHSL
jgi:hypothetical protein